MTGPHLDLGTMPVHARAIWLDAHERGYLEGMAAGLRLADEEWAGRLEVSKAIARQVSESGTFDELAERRGQPERAARQRALLRDRGVVA